jgi:histidinol-phosphate/aromatic aminotransferase/cobyric acid decarboxylase-like protein
VAVQLSPVLAELAQYPFARLDDWKADAAARGIELIDFGMGDPREVTPPFIREALLASVDEVSSYPRAPGLPQLREAIAGWIDRRFGVAVDPGSEIVPTLGSKEAIFSFAQLALGDKRVVAIPEPAYPVYERGALFGGGSVVTVPLAEQNAWLPDLEAFDAWDEIAIFWTCYPNNPTGGARARARLPALLRRGVLRALVRRAAGVGAAGRRSHERRRLQHVVEALLDDRLPLGVRLRATGDRDGAEELPPDRRYRAAGIRAAGIGRRVVG